MERCVRVAAVIVALGAAAALAGCKKPAEAAPTAKTEEKVRVVTRRVESRKVPESLPVSGALEAELETDLAANASGKVIQSFIERGQAVKKGETLFRLDTRLAGLQASAARAQADVGAADLERELRECERMQKLTASGAVAAAEGDRQAARCKIAERSLAAQKANAQVAAQVVSDGRVVAPFSGYIVDRWVDVGEYVRPDTRVTTLVQLDNLRVKIAVPEAHFALLVSGRRIGLHVPAYPGRTFEAKLTRISPAVRAATRDVVAEAVVPNADHSLLPGMFASAELEVGQRELPVVPRTSLVERDGTVHVFVLVNGRLEERAVQAGPAVGDEVSIVRGLSLGEAVVDKPAANVKNGAPAGEG